MWHSGRTNESGDNAWWRQENKMASISIYTVDIAFNPAWLLPFYLISSWPQPLTGVEIKFSRDADPRFIVSFRPWSLYYLAFLHFTSIAIHVVSPHSLISGCSFLSLSKITHGWKLPMMPFVCLNEFAIIFFLLFLWMISDNPRDGTIPKEWAANRRPWRRIGRRRFHAVVGGHLARGQRTSIMQFHLITPGQRNWQLRRNRRHRWVQWQCGRNRCS